MFCEIVKCYLFFNCHFLQSMKANQWKKTLRNELYSQFMHLTLIKVECLPPTYLYDIQIIVDLFM